MALTIARGSFCRWPEVHREKWLPAGPLLVDQIVTSHGALQWAW